MPKLFKLDDTITVSLKEFTIRDIRNIMGELSDLNIDVTPNQLIADNIERLTTLADDYVTITDTTTDTTIDIVDLPFSNLDVIYEHFKEVNKSFLSKLESLTGMKLDQLFQAEPVEQTTEPQEITQKS